MKRKAPYPLSLAAAAVVVAVTSTPMRAEQGSSASADDRTTPMLTQTHDHTTPRRDDAIRPRVNRGVATKIHVYMKELKDDAVGLDVHEGVITLTGTVAEESHKALAQTAVANLPGIIRVDNQVTIKTEAVAENTDARNGPKLKNEIAVMAIPEPAKRLASDKRDDASVTSKVKTPPLAHRSSPSVKTQGEAQDGGVTSTGMAANAADKPTVTKLVTDIQGLASVEEPMTVEKAMTK